MNSYTHDGLIFPVLDIGSPDRGTVVLAHGFPQTRTSWETVGHSLASQGYRVLIPTQRGYCQTSTPSRWRDYRLKLLVSDVRALLRAAGTPRCHLVGHDWGGAVAWGLAIESPELIDRLCVVSMPHPQALIRAMPGSQLLKSAYLPLLMFPLIPETLILHANGLVRSWLRRTGLPDTYAREYADALRRTALGSVNWYRALPFNLGYLRAPGCIKVPTLFIWSDGDVAISRRAADLTVEYLNAKSEYVVMEKVSHWIPEVLPATLSRRIVDYLERQDG